MADAILEDISRFSMEAKLKAFSNPTFLFLKLHYSLLGTYACRLHLHEFSILLFYFYILTGIKYLFL